MVLGELEQYDRELREKEELIYFLKRNLQQIEKEVITDRRSGLFSSSFFHARLKEEIARSERYRHFLSLILIRIEPAEKDSTQNRLESLRRIGRQISLCLIRKSDVLAAFRQGQIVIILPETDPDGARAVMQRYLSITPAGSEKIDYATLSYPEDASNIELVLNLLEEHSDRLNRGTDRAVRS